MDFAKFRPRGGTKAQWETANPVLGKREMGIQWESEIGVGKVVIKFGNGVTAWNNLDTAVEVENDLVNKIISSIVTVSDEYPILNDGDSLSTLVGKIKKYIQDLKDKKLDKSARYDGTDSTSTELVPTANALRGVNAKADKNASDITTLNNNLSKRLLVGDNIASADLLNDNPAERFGTLSMRFSDGTINQLLLLKDTAVVTILRNNVWQEQYRLATTSMLSDYISKSGIKFVEQYLKSTQTLSPSGTTLLNDASITIPFDCIGILRWKLWCKSSEQKTLFYYMVNNAYVQGEHQWDGTVQNDEAIDIFVMGRFSKNQELTVSVRGNCSVVGNNTSLTRYSFVFIPV